MENISVILFRRHPFARTTLLPLLTRNQRTCQVDGDVRKTSYQNKIYNMEVRMSVEDPHAKYTGTGVAPRPAASMGQ